MAHDDIQETTVQFNHTEGLVNFYTTRRSVFLQIVRRNPSFLKAVELTGGGYEIDYRAEEVKSVQQLLKLKEGSADEQFLTDREKATRADSAKRLAEFRYSRAA